MKIRGLISLLICVVLDQFAFGQNQANLIGSNIGTMNPSASFFGSEPAERIGYALAGGGDVNGDGFDDFLIGTFHNDLRGMDAGAAYLFLGHTSLRWGLGDSVASADARFLGQQTYDAAGYSVACNGDLNGDGFDDIIIGAPAGNDRVPWMSGRIYIIFGEKEANWGKEFTLFDSSDAIYEGDGLQDLAGLSVAYIGDVNNDGFDDILVGAPFKDSKYVNTGIAYLILGRSGPWLPLDYLTYADASFIYEREGAELGYSVAGVGDVNDDGISDFAIGSMGTSRVFVMYGRNSVNWGKNFDLENADLILYGTYRYTNEGLGWKIAGAGDLNGDGISDMAISAIHDSEYEFQAGKVFVLFGKSGGWATQEFALKDGDASFVGEQTTDQAGWGLAIAGDVDEDGYDDFLIGAYKDDSGPIDGKAYLIRGKATGWQMNVPLATVPGFWARDSSGIGYTISSAGDFDKDGVADFIISAPFNSEIQKWNGKVYLFASQLIPYQISGTVSYFQTNLSIPGAFMQADRVATAVDTTDSWGHYTLPVRSRRNHSVFIDKQKGEHVGSAITSFDAALIARLAINLTVPDTVNSHAADVNGDRLINMYDAANTLRYAVELPPLDGARTGEWKFIPDSMFYDSIIADQPEQNYVGYVIGDVDLSWQEPDSGLMKVGESKVISQFIKRDEEYRLPITIHSEGSFISYDLDLGYDQQVLQFVRIEQGDLASNFKLAYNDKLQNRLRIGGFAQKPVQQQGLLITIVFKLVATESGQTTIMLNRFQLDNVFIQKATVNLKFDDRTGLPEKFELEQNYPNPFNGSTMIAFSVPNNGHVEVAIYNLLGKKIRSLMNQNLAAGKYQLNWDGKDEYGNGVTSGVYICKASYSNINQKIKIIHIK